MNNSWFLIKESALTGFINNDVQYNFNYGITYALSFGYNFSKNAGIEIESAFSRQGQSYVDNSSRKVPIEGDINLSYFQVPVLIKYKWSRVAAITQNPASFNILIGPIYSRLIQSDYTVNNDLFAKTDKTIIPKNELGLAFGLEYDIYMTNNTYLTLGARTSVSTDVKSFPYFGPNNLKTLNVLLGVNASLNFQIRPKLKTTDSILN
jgi:hypothetical protein